MNLTGHMQSKLMLNTTVILSAIIYLQYKRSPVILDHICTAPWVAKLLRSGTAVIKDF